MGPKTVGRQSNWLHAFVAFSSLAVAASAASSFVSDDYAKQAREILSKSQLIDGHNDMPYAVRAATKLKVYDGAFPFDTELGSHTDLKKLRRGQVGGQFWSVYVDCAADNSTAIDDPTWSVRDTLEQIDVTKRMVEEWSDDLHYCDNPTCARKAFKDGKIASFIGIEGGHQVGNSLGAIRQFFDLGARYITITHNCDNAFATAASTVTDGGEDKGLTEFGEEFVQEMNRLGMLIDLAHVSHDTMRDVLAITETPVMFSHSSAYALSHHLRNVPDDVLKLTAENGGVVMANFVPSFLKKDDPDSADIHDAVEHIWHIAQVAGWDHVGVGGDFDGSDTLAHGLDDTSKYPDLVALLLKKGATEEQIRKFAGENILRVWAENEAFARGQCLAGVKPNEATWEGRHWVEENITDPFS